MTYLQAIFLGCVQGLTEFLPISSSGHLILMEHFFHIKGGGLTFDVFLHLGTLCAVIGYFWQDWWRFLYASISGKDKEARRLFFFIILATIPGALAGVVMAHAVETVFRDPFSVAFMLLLMSIPLLVAEWVSSQRYLIKDLSLWKALSIGMAQALAIIPGTSRSGITMATGLFLGLRRDEAAHFSFLLSAPIIAGAGLFKMIGAVKTGMVFSPIYMVGFLSSLISGVLVIAWLLSFLKQHTFYPFVIYRVGLAGSIYALVKFLNL